MEAVRSILVVRLSSIGDIILTTPVVRWLRVRWPEAKIDFCTRAPFLPLLAGSPRLSGVYSPESLPASSSYDLVVDLQNNRRSHALLGRVGAKKTVRYHKGNWKKWILVHWKIDLYGEAPSVVERYGSSLLGLGIKVDDSGCELWPSASDTSLADGILPGEGKVLAVCFGARHFTKRWPPRRFAEVILGILNAVPSLRVVLLGGEDDAAHAEEIMGLLPAGVAGSVRNLAGACSLMETGALLQRSDAVLTNDTGLMHMASAFQKRLFVLFGSSSLAFGFLPYRSTFELFEVSGLGCRPCSHIGRERCPKGHFRCMLDIPPERVSDRIIAFLGGAQR
ncbi:glycosyltransferase family 9 protein [Pelodictyon luteolum]|uniref:Heptosyltransferase n=1 Tax=Chlorobium luteolum (strain DSM 273 / BCRC 81028 / 2530) TaxID=319225 RepID=Q3B6M9_CHLL3|nr:glycosyltransferase family 9 protein [Pelodictyon luteolum]ABB23002.1 heptosyltransferase [Pelodictyon luteolum DSM 273]